jgi:soluble cytochrome b562
VSVAGYADGSFSQIISEKGVGTMTEEQKEESTIFEEFEALGQQLATAVKALWESEDSRKTRQDLREGFDELGRQLDTAIRSAQESEAAKEFGDQVRETVDKARQTDMAGKLEQGIVAGLRGLNEELDNLVRSLQEKDAPPPDQEAKPEG